MREYRVWPFCLGVVVALVGVALMAWSVRDALDRADDVAKDDNDDEMCVQVITPARNPETGEVVDFPTPCDVPEGWEVVEP